MLGMNRKMQYEMIACALVRARLQCEYQSISNKVFSLLLVSSQKLLGVVQMDACGAERPHIKSPKEIVDYCGPIRYDTRLRCL